MVKPRLQHSPMIWPSPSLLYDIQPYELSTITTISQNDASSRPVGALAGGFRRSAVKMHSEQDGGAFDWT